MCGISGIIDKKNRAIDRSLIEKMIHAQKHRGPDGEGVFEGPGFFLGHNRLAIIDLTPAGHQPMIFATETGQRLILTYNGEIYNYLELREELRALGHIFKTETDSEVLLHAYQEWGTACLDRFNGMFAFVIYDESKRELFGARDRFGVKPLHLRLAPETFSFASEIKALLAISSSQGFDRQAVVDYLYSGHINHSSRTFFKDIETLKAGHFFKYDLGQHQIKIQPWYVLRDHVRSLNLDEKTAADQLKMLLTDSVKLRLRSDVRVGTCLSGGIDSSSIAALAAKESARAPNSTTRDQAFIGITAQSLDLENDETAFAKTVAENSKLEWHCVRPQDFRANLTAVIQTQDEPFTGLSVFMQDAVMSEARKIDVPVLLDGQGGDEVFLGYPKYLQALRAPPPRLLVKKIASSVGWIEPREFENELRKSSPHELDEARASLLRYRRALSDSREAQVLDITETNLPQLLRYEDRNSMRHSIETRLPFLDYRLVEFGLGLAQRLKIRSGFQKAVLRDAMRDVVPAAVLQRRDKIGFASPDRSWSPHFKALWNTHVAGSEFLKDLAPGLTHRSFESSLAAGLSPSAHWKLINLAIWSESYFT